MKKVLVIEDDIETLDLMEQILREAGYAVIKAKREVPIKEIAAIMPDLAILDYHLPFGSGSQKCLEIKTNPTTAPIPVILYSASTHLKKLAEACKANAFIAKPFNIEELIELIAKITL